MARGLAMLAMLLAVPFLRGQMQRDNALSDGEIEQVRDVSYVPNDKVLLFVKFLDERSHRVHELFAKARKPGREEDAHDLIEQFTAIADELADNLEDAGARHADVRKALPKLLTATERWSSELKSAPEDDAYNVSRKIALETISDLREVATKLGPEQAAWFKEHPPEKPAPPTDQDGMPIAPAK